MLILFVLRFEGGRVTLGSGKIKAQRIRLRQYNAVNYRLLYHITYMTYMTYNLYDNLRHLSFFKSLA